MNKVNHGVAVDKNSEGIRVEGYINGDRVITVTNRNLRRKFEVSHSKALVGSYEEAKAISDIIKAVIDIVESLRAEHEGKITIAVVSDSNKWKILINKGEHGVEKTREEAIVIAQYLKQGYERVGVIVNYTEE